MRTNQIKTKVTSDLKVLMQTYVTEATAKSFQEMVKSRGGLSVREVMREALANEIQRQTLCLPKKEISLIDLSEKVDQLRNMITKQDAQIRLQTALMHSIGQAVGINQLGLSD